MLSNAMNPILFAILIWILARQLSNKVGLTRQLKYRVGSNITHIDTSLQKHCSIPYISNRMLLWCISNFSISKTESKQERLCSLGWAFILLVGKNNLAFHLLLPLSEYCLCKQISFYPFDLSLLTRKNCEFSLVRVYLVYQRNFPCHVQ